MTFSSVFMNRLTHYSGVSTIDFEELNAGWDACTEKLVSCFSLARKV